jgi:DNA polymerase-3 subunit delta'
VSARLEPATNSHLVGHERAEALVLEAWRRGRLPHAWLLNGPKGVGKATLAFRLARRYLAGDPSSDAAQDPWDPVFRQIVSGVQPDFYLLQPRGRGSRRGMRNEEEVNVVRERITALLRTSANASGRRVLLVDDVDLTLNDKGYNALLKLLEEPPAGVLFLLVTARPGAMPATIASRCARLRLAPLSEERVERVLGLVAPELDEPVRHRLAVAAGGSPGRALLLHESGWLDSYGGLVQALAAAPDSLAARLEAAQLLQRFAQSQGIGVAAELAAQLVRRAALDAVDVTPGPELVEGEGRYLAALAATQGLDRLIALWDKLHALTGRTEALNLDPLQAFFRVVEAIVDPARDLLPAER